MGGILADFLGRRHPLYQRCHERTVRLENVLAAELRALHPLQALAIETPRLASVATYDPHGKLYIAIRIAMCQPHHRTRVEHHDTELFVQLGRQSGLLRLARRDLAAGKLPPAGHVLARGTLGDEHSPEGIRQSRRHDQNGPARLGHSTLDRAPWQCLYFFPEPQGQGSLRPILRSPRTKVPWASGGGGAAAGASMPRARAPPPIIAACAAAAPAAASAGISPPPASADIISGCCAWSARISRRRRSSSSRSTS